MKGYLSNRFVISTVKGICWTFSVLLVGTLVSILGKKGSLKSSLDILSIVDLLSPYDYGLILVSALGGLLIDYITYKRQLSFLFSFLPKFSFSFLPFIFLLIFMVFMKGKSFEELNKVGVFTIWNLLGFVFVSFLKSLFFYFEEISTGNIGGGL